jgi:hypothetical protein
VLLLVLNTGSIFTLHQQTQGDPMQRAMTITIRDIGHFLSTYLAAFAALWANAGQPTTRNALLALAPAAATVAFRQLCPFLGQSRSITVPATITPQVSPLDPLQRSAL